MSDTRTPPSPLRSVFMPAILRRLAPRLGAEVIFEPQGEIVGRIRFPNGRQSYFWHNKFNLNSVASARITSDKGHTNFFLGQAGFRVPRSGVFLQETFRKRVRWGRSREEARVFAEQLGWDVYLKPLNRSQGSGILRACGEEEYGAAEEEIFATERKVLVEEACPGRDFRLVVLDGEVISAYERIPLTITGDGRQTVSTLLQARQAEFDVTGRDTVLNLLDPRMAVTLARGGWDFESVLPAGHAVRMLDVANLSRGGTSREATAEVHPEMGALAARVAATLDLRFAGVDLLTPDLNAPPGEDYTVLEVNSAPGLDHYASHGAEHEAHIDELYLKVLRAIERGAGG